MSALETLRGRIPEFGRDLRVNLQTVLAPEGPLTPAQRWGSAVAAAAAVRFPPLRDAVLEEARRHVGAEVIDDALAAAILMGMNNVYYRFRHLVENPTYAQKPARLRMQRIGKPLGPKADFELFCLVVSAINGCGTCMASHDRVARDGGVSEDQIHDAVRIGAVIAGVAQALQLVDAVASEAA